MRTIRFLAFFSGGSSLIIVLALSLGIITFTWLTAVFMLPVIVYGLLKSMYRIITE